MFFCGIDVAKREHDAPVINREGRQVFHLRFKNRREPAEAFPRKKTLTPAGPFN